MKDFTPLIEETWNEERVGFEYNLRGRMVKLFEKDLENKSPLNSHGFQRSNYDKKKQAYSESKRIILDFLESKEMTLEEAYKFFLQIQFNMKQSKEPFKSKEIMSKVETVIKKIEEAKPKLKINKDIFIDEIKSQDRDNPNPVAYMKN